MVAMMGRVSLEFGLCIDGAAQSKVVVLGCRRKQLMSLQKFTLLPKVMAGMVHDMWRFHGPSAQYFCMSFVTSFFGSAGRMLWIFIALLDGIG